MVGGENLRTNRGPDNRKHAVLLYTPPHRQSLVISWRSSRALIVSFDTVLVVPRRAALP